MFIKYCVFFQEFSKVCHLSLASNRLLLVLEAKYEEGQGGVEYDCCLKELDIVASDSRIPTEMWRPLLGADLQVLRKWWTRLCRLGAKHLYRLACPIYTSQFYLSPLSFKKWNDTNMSNSLSMCSSLSMLFEKSSLSDFHQRLNLSGVAIWSSLKGKKNQVLR